MAKKFKVVLLLGLVVGLVLLGIKVKFRREGRDWKLAVVSDEGLAMISISKDREMLNVLNIDPTMPVWIPEGFGWYSGNKVKKLLNQERRWDLAKKIFFYNFGLVSDELVISDGMGDWRDWRYGWKYKLLARNLVEKEETEVSDEGMVRDFSDSSLINDETRIVVINETEEDGLAGFVAKSLERSGLSVVGIENSRGGKSEGCLWLYNRPPERVYAAEIMRKMLNCEEKVDDGLAESEWELYLGEDWAKMINYSSYVGSL